MPLYLGKTLIGGSSRPVDAEPTAGSNNLISSGGVKSYIDEQIAAIPTPDVSGQIGTHNQDTTAHPDIRRAIQNIQVPVQSVNGKTGAVQLTANDVGAATTSAVQTAQATANEAKSSAESAASAASTAQQTANAAQSAVNSKAPATHASQHASSGSDPITPASIGAAASDHTHDEYAPAYTYGTADLTAGTSELETGKLYFVYE